MFVERKIENAAVAIISGSLVSGSANWQIYQGMANNVSVFPCVKVICTNYQPLYKELNLGMGKVELELMTCALKINASDISGSTTASEFERVSDLVFNPFLSNTIASTISSSTTNLIVQMVAENGLEVTTLDDGWVATQKFEIVCGRTA